MCSFFFRAAAILTTLAMATAMLPVPAAICRQTVSPCSMPCHGWSAWTDKHVFEHLHVTSAIVQGVPSLTFHRRK